MNTTQNTATRITIRELPVTEQPQERLRRHGPAALSSAELLAIVLGLTDLGQAEALLARYGGLDGLVRAPLAEIAGHQRGIGLRKAGQLKAILELGRQPVNRRWTVHDERYLTGPLIVADPTWGEDTPIWLRKAVRIARLALILAGEEEHASEEEAVVYLMAASLAAPLDTDWAEIYLWLAARVLKRWGKPDLELDVIRQILWPHQQDDLDRLLRTIRRSVERHANTHATASTQEEDITVEAEEET